MENRFRSIRNDRSIQSAWSPGMVSLTEQIARYILVLNHDLCDYGESERYSEKRNKEQFEQTYSPLMELYMDNANRPPGQRWDLPNEAEFTGYSLLYNLPEVPQNTRRMPERLRRLPDTR